MRTRIKRVASVLSLAALMVMTMGLTAMAQVVPNADLVDGVQDAADGILANVGALVPIVLTVVGFLVAISVGIRFLRRFAR